MNIIFLFLLGLQRCPIHCFLGHCVPVCHIVSESILPQYRTIVSSVIHKVRGKQAISFLCAIALQVLQDYSLVPVNGVLPFWSLCNSSMFYCFPVAVLSRTLIILAASSGFSPVECCFSRPVFQKGSHCDGLLWVLLS